MTYNVLKTLFASENSDLELLNTESESLSYKFFCQKVTDKSKLIEKHGAVSVAIICEDYVDVFSWVFAVWKASGRAILLNPSLTKEHLSHCLKKSDPDLIIRENSLDPIRSRKSSAPAELVIFTSGSTGPPKGVLQQMSQVSQNSKLVSESLGLSSKDRLFINTPAYFTSGLIHFLTQISAGGSLVARAGFYFGEDLIKLVVENKCTGFGGAPTHFAKFFDDENVKFPESLRFVVSSGDHLPVHLIEKAKRAAPGLKIFTIYGLTEVSGRLCILDAKYIPAKSGSVGKPLLGMEIQILDVDNRVVNCGKLGEVYVKGPMLMRGYLNEPEKNKEVLTSKGFRTGDMGFLDEEGFLWLRGRQDGVFKSGAEKVSTMIIEEQLMASGFFNDVAVVAKADALLGHVPVCFYVLKPGVEFKRVKVNKILKKTLPASHIPRAWNQVETIPRTESGKIKKHAFNEKLAM